MPEAKIIDGAARAAALELDSLVRRYPTREEARAAAERVRARQMQAIVVPAEPR